MTKRRSKRAAALLTVLVMSAVSMIFLMALATTVTAAIKAASSDKWVEGLRNCAEVGVDYAVDKFNTVYPCPLDPSTSGTLTTILPASELIATPVNGATPNAGTGVSNVTVTIKVTRLKPADWLWLRDNCTVYSPQIDPNNSSSNGWLSPASTNITTSSGGGFRVIESTASNGVISRTVRVILKARFGVQPDGSKPLEVGGTTPTTANYFQQPLFGNSAINITDGQVAGTPGVGGVTHPSSSNGTLTFNLNVATNTQASIGAGSTLSGDLTVADGSSAGHDVATGAGTIEGRLFTNGTTSSDLASYTDNGNVQARADNPSPGDYSLTVRAGDNLNQLAIESGKGLSQAQLSPIATPSTATTLTDLSNYVGAGNSPTTTGATVFQTQSLSTDNVPAGQTVDFSSPSATAPVQIFVNQGTTSGTAVNIDTSKLSAGSSNSADFQIWYEGNKNVTINLTKDFSGLIYAPNANVTLQNVAGLPSSLKYTGAVVGKVVNVSLKSGSLSVDTGLATGGSGGGGGGKDPDTYKYKMRAGLGTVVQGWQPITWQEFGVQ